MTRRAITKTQLKPLIALTRNMCAMHDHAPSCDRFSLVQNDKFVGEIAHIAAAEEVGITLANLSILKNGKAKAICVALDRQPGDIASIKPTNATTIAKSLLCQ